VHQSAQVIGPEQDDAGSDGEIIVFLLWHLGDVLIATALLPELEARHGRKLSFATTAPCVPIVAHHPSLARIRVVDRVAPVVMTLPMCVDLREMHERLYPRAAAVYNLHLPVKLHQMPHHIVELWAREARIDKRWDELRPAYYPGSPGRGPEVEGEYLVLGNGGSARGKHWPAERWQNAIGALRERHAALRFVQLGVASDPLLDGVEDLRGTSIDESHRLLRGARGCLTTDSFLAHLSAAADRPTIVLFGPTCPRHFRPLGGSHVIPLGGHGFRTPCTRNLCRLTPGSPCHAFPGTKRVIAAVDRILARAPRPA